MKRKIKVALADDHNLFRKGVEELINEFDNMQVIYSEADGQALINRLSTGTQLPDVCLLDINMPEMDGYETAKKIKSNWPQISILAVSVYDSEFNILGMLRAGAGGYILKDVQPSILRNAILSLYEKGFYHSELVTEKILQQASYKPVTLYGHETQFLKLCCSEMTYKEIAHVMGVSHRTVDGYRDNLFEKLYIKSRTGLAIYALKTGLVTLDSLKIGIPDDDEND